MLWTETCQPASFARPIVAVRSAGSQLHDRARAIVQVDLQPLDAEAVVDASPARDRRVPVPEELLVEVQGEVGVDAKRQGVVGGEASSSSRRSWLTHCSEIEVQPRVTASVHGFGRRIRLRSSSRSPIQWAWASMNPG